MKYPALLLSIVLLFSFNSCKQGGESNKAGSEFDPAYPEVYTALNLPEYRKGSLMDVSGKSEGVKTDHNILINTDESPRLIGAYINEEMEKLQWNKVPVKRSLSKISEDDLYYATFSKGTNRFHVNAATTPDGSTKLRIILSTFSG